MTLAEASAELGGRVARECRLPHAGAWGRVRDHRLQQIAKLPEVEIFSGKPASTPTESSTSAIPIWSSPRVAYWRRDGIARHHLESIPIAEGAADPDARRSDGGRQGRQGRVA